MSTCPLCGGNDCATQGAEFGVIIFCKNDYIFHIYDSVSEAYGDQRLAQIERYKRYNLIYEFISKHGNSKKIDESYLSYKFWYRLPDQSQSDNPVLINVFELMKNYPKNVGEKLDRVLLNLAKKYPNIGDEFSISQLPRALLFLETNLTTERDTIAEYMRKLDYFILNDNNHSSNNTNNPLLDFWKYKLSAKAWERISELQQKSDINNKDVFVAMSYHDSESIREAIRQAIANTAFSASFMDEIIHNKQIVPEMLRLIKESRFLIMDISNPNYGAYFEAGYAAGIGKEVIITCREDIFEKKDYTNRLEEKALKPHFDIAQKQILRWKDEADLTAKLEQWIKFLF